MVSIACRRSLRQGEKWVSKPSRPEFTDSLRRGVSAAHNGCDHVMRELESCSEPVGPYNRDGLTLVKLAAVPCGIDRQVGLLPRCLPSGHALRRAGTTRSLELWRSVMPDPRKAVSPPPDADSGMSPEALKEYATKLSERLERLEAWFNAQPVRLRAEAHEDAPSPDGTRLHLRLSRQGGQWQIEYWEEVLENPITAMVTAVLPGPGAKAEWRALRSAPIELKLRAVAGLDRLFAAHDRRREILNVELEVAHEQMSRLEKQLGVNVKEGK
jgi:hypothetical protein